MQLTQTIAQTLTQVRTQSLAQALTQIQTHKHNIITQIHCTNVNTKLTQTLGQALTQTHWITLNLTQ